MKRFISIVIGLAVICAAQRSALEVESLLLIAFLSGAAKKLGERSMEWLLGFMLRNSGKTRGRAIRHRTETRSRSSVNGAETPAERERIRHAPEGAHNSTIARRLE